jgi:hypothetical protein
MSKPTSLREPGNPAGPPSNESLRVIAEALQGLQFGSITIVVQDGVVIQVDRTEKRRLTRGVRTSSQP